MDLFAGAGGLSVGAIMAGADVRASVELDPTACATLRANPEYHGSVIEADVSALSGTKLRKVAGLKKGDPLIIVGGAPCQPFSKAAYWVEAGHDAAYRRARARGEQIQRPLPPAEARPDERRDLVSEFWRLIEESQADGFVFENVPSIRHPRNRPVLDAFIQAAHDAGYETLELQCNAAEYGVPQTRERVFVLGSRARKPRAPEPTHYLPDEPSLLLKPAVTAGEALLAFEADEFFEPEEIVQGRWATHLQTVPPGWNYKAHTAWAGHPEPTFVTETRFWNFLLKLSPDRPSWTLAANPGPWTGPFHWKTRRLRTVEMAVLQGFPPDYKVMGKRRERVRQLGNAAPPPIAARMVDSIVATLS